MRLFRSPRGHVVSDFGIRQGRLAAPGAACRLAQETGRGVGQGALRGALKLRMVTSALQERPVGLSDVIKPPFSPERVVRLIISAMSGAGGRRHRLAVKHR